MTEKKSQEKKEKDNYSFYIVETSATRLAGFTGIFLFPLPCLNRAAFARFRYSRNAATPEAWWLREDPFRPKSGAQSQ